MLSVYGLEAVRGRSSKKHRCESCFVLFISVAKKKNTISICSGITAESVFTSRRQCWRWRFLGTWRPHAFTAISLVKIDDAIRRWPNLGDDEVTTLSCQNDQRDRSLGHDLKHQRNIMSKKGNSEVLGLVSFCFMGFPLMLVICRSKNIIYTHTITCTYTHMTWRFVSI